MVDGISGGFCGVASHHAGGCGNAANRAPNIASLMAAGVAILAFIADNPGKVGRVRAAKILTGGITEEDFDRGVQLEPGTCLAFTDREVVSMVDELITGGLVAKSYGDRPRLALTRDGHRMLVGLEGAR